MKCPECGTESSGNYCPSCGTALRDANCAACGATLVPGARFCTQCGAAVGAAGATGGSGAPAARPAGGGSNLPWYIATAVLVVLVVILAVPMITGDEPAAVDRAPFGTPTGAGLGTPPPLTGTPREQADRLFDRIMRASESGDAATVEMFMPMATQAYDLARPLDNDGLFHLAVIHNVGGNYAQARVTAEEILERNPDHLLALAVAGEAAQLAGDAAAARDYYGRFLDAYDAEVARALPEYQDHAPVLPDYREAALRVTGR
jgi:hypothetical protein